MKRILISTTLLSLLLLVSTITFAQMGPNTYDLNIDANITGNNDNDVNVKTFGLQKNIFKHMIKQGQKGILNMGFNYKYAQLNFNTNEDFFSNLQDFHSLGVNLSYIRRINEKWMFIGMINPQLSSNFTGKLTSDDFYLNLIGLINYSSNMNNRLTFGLVYSNSRGIPFPMPVITYWRKLNEQWEINLGFPRLGTTYTLNPQSSFSGYIELDGYNANISNNMSSVHFEEARMAEQINYLAIISGIEYQYKADKFSFKVNLGYTLGQTFELQNSNHDTAYEFDMGSNLNFGIGVGFNF